jgi:hypothetical protein
MRRIITAALACFGVWYIVIGARTLLHLQEQTQRWIVSSGDPDFRFDAGLFAFAIGAGAALVLTLGAASLACAIGSLRGRPWRGRSIVFLAIAALLLHVPWFLYRTIATGHLPRGLAAEPIRAFGLRVLAVYVLYAAVWLTHREPAWR